MVQAFPKLEPMGKGRVYIYIPFNNGSENQRTGFET
jgi:hypothetical protein